MILKAKGSWTQFVDVLDRHEAFETHGALRGEPGNAQGNAHGWGWGRLSEEYHASVNHADYVVYSYGTPIAWHHIESGWVMPDEKYSATTSAHQSKIQVALSAIRHRDRFPEDE